MKREQTNLRKDARLFWTGVTATLAAILLVTAFAPLERTLGSNLRMILLHGAWAWAGLVFFGLAALAGLGGLAEVLFRNAGATRLGNWSQPLAWTAMGFWLTYLPMSLWVMQANWGGFFFAEPRWRIPFTFAVVGVLLQAGLALVNRPVLNLVANPCFGTALWLSLLRSQAVLHPESPVMQSGAAGIQAAYGLLLVLALLLGVQIVLKVMRLQKR